VLWLRSSHIPRNDWRLDMIARHLLDAQGTIVALSGAEYRLLRVVLDHPQRVLTRDQLLNLTQGRQADAFDRSIDLLVDTGARAYSFTFG
jgi:two-component system OmpR family response regulator